MWCAATSKSSHVHLVSSPFRHDQCTATSIILSDACWLYIKCINQSEIISLYFHTRFAFQCTLVQCEWSTIALSDVMRIAYIFVLAPMEWYNVRDATTNKRGTASHWLTTKFSTSILLQPPSCRCNPFSCNFQSIAWNMQSTHKLKSNYFKHIYSTIILTFIVRLLPFVADATAQHIHGQHMTIALNDHIKTVWASQ